MLTSCSYNYEAVGQTISKFRDISQNFVYIWLTFSREPLFIFSILAVFPRFFHVSTYLTFFVFVYEFLNIMSFLC